MVGILRAQMIFNKRRTPYHRALGIFIFVVLLGLGTSRAQTVEHYEGILIDTSASISRGGTTNDLFQDYLLSTKKLLLTEPPNSRVWVSSIATDSFGGVGELLMRECHFCLRKMLSLISSCRKIIGRSLWKTTSGTLAIRSQKGVTY
jgi:hypothetical protein